jgi:hypothetical protein
VGSGVVCDITGFVWLVFEDNLKGVAGTTSVGASGKGVPGVGRAGLQRTRGVAVEFARPPLPPAALGQSRYSSHRWSCSEHSFVD